MDQALIDFAGRLRKSGLMVSLAEVLDAGQGLEHLELRDRPCFKDGLRALLIKRQADIPVFDALFDLFFSGRPILGPLEEPNDQPEETLAVVINELIESGQAELSLMAELAATGRFGALTKLVLARGRGLGLDRLESPLQVNFFLRRFKQELNLERVKKEIDSFLNRLSEMGINPEQAGAIKAYTERNLERVEDELGRLIKREMAANRFIYTHRFREEEKLTKNLARLTEQEIQAMRPLVERLARRLRDRLSLRLRRNDQGRFDLKRTLRRNIGYDGQFPFLEFRRKRIDRPRIVALCDVSNSVKNFSRFMLLFLYTLGEIVSKVRSYVFIGDLAEVTDIFKHRPINEAVALAAAAKGLKYVTRTDYGNSLTQFCQEHLSVVTDKTTVIIQGDGRNNYYPPCPEALRTIASRARRLIWLNPEPQLNWRLGDSVMGMYRPYCTVLAECGNVNQLSEILTENLLP